MAKFCRRCGKQLGPDGICPGCGYRDLSPRPAAGGTSSGRTAGGKARATAPAAGKKNRGGKIAVAVILICLLLVLAICLLQYFGLIDFRPADALLGLLGLNQSGKDKGTDPPSGEDGPVITDYDIPEGYLEELPDAEAFYEEYAESYRKIPVKQASGIRSESSVLEDYARRGFTLMPVYTDCLMDGSDIERTEITQDSSDRHPRYETVYYTEKEEIWSILEFNGELFAIPESYNWRRFEEGQEIQVVVSETDRIVSYDQTTNCYFETVPKEPIVVYRVEKIDSETLEALSRGDLGW